MTEQLTFANSAPIAATADPATSHEAAAALTASGARDMQKRRVLAALRKFPFVTSAELAQMGHLDRYECARRLPDLERDGLAVRQEPRPCAVTGKRAQTWRAAK